MKTEIAVLGGGCFWCLEAAFSELPGILGVQSGYAGGQRPNPTYEQVCSGLTGHAEVVKITFDPDTISYAALLEFFFALHDPTTPNRQGADVGRQYRSIILTRDAEQAQTAQKVIAHLTAEQVFSNPIVTQVQPLDKFYPAEDYHQQYYQKNRQAGYCRVVIEPKLAKLRSRVQTILKETRNEKSR